MFVLHELGRWLATTGQMAWQIGWTLILGFGIASVVQALIKKETVAALLPDSRPITVVKAAGLGIASSSCSYAAAALARTLVRKGANFAAAMAFQIASTNLVIELGIILALLIGWPFTLAEFVGGAIMIIIVVLLVRRISAASIGAAREQAERGLAGSMEGHAGMDMSVAAEADGSGPKALLRKLFTPTGFTSVADIFVMEWAAILRDLVIGLFIAGAAAAWIPDAFWQGLFAAGNPTLASIIGPLLGPLVAIATFVCSVGNIPLAAVLWNGGISFGGVVSFVFADLLIVPLLLIYRRYYGARMTIKLTGIFYLAAVVAGYLVELVFGLIGLIPQGARHASAGSDSITFNYTTVLNIVFFAIAAVLVIRFFRTGGGSMLSMMNGEPAGVGSSGGHDQHGHDHSHDHHGHDQHGHDRGHQH